MFYPSSLSTFSPQPRLPSVLLSYNSTTHLYWRHSSLTHDSFSPSLTLSSTLPQPSSLITLHLLAPQITGLIVVNTIGSSQVLFLSSHYQLSSPISQPICFFFTPRYGFWDGLWVPISISAIGFLRLSRFYHWVFVIGFVLLKTLKTTWVCRWVFALLNFYFYFW